MNQPTIQNMTNDELQIFHSALCLIEETIYEHDKDTPLTRKLNIITKKINSTFPELEDEHKEYLLEIINQQNKTILTDKKNNHPQPHSTYKHNLLQTIRNIRKQYDEAYIKSILSTKLNENPYALNQVKNFINSIKTQDPYYYDNIVTSILKNFREIAKSQTQIHANRYEVTPKLLEYVENARQCINLILDDYKIEHIKQKEKPYALRYLDRSLFNGCLNKINSPTPPSTFATMSANALDSIAILKQHQQEGQCYHNSENAEILITCLEYHMKEKHLENQPFPVLVNSFIQEKGQNGTIPFFKYDKKLKEHTSNITLSSYYCQASDKIRNYPKPRILKPGIKHQKDQRLLEQETLLENICINAKQVLINLCTENNISPDIIHIAFGLYTHDSNGQYNPSGYKNLYKWLTEHNMKNGKGYETNPNGEYYGPIFVTSRHHDREQINFSTSANTTENNMILTLPMNTKASVKLILNNIINRIELMTFDSKMIEALKEERAKINSLQTTEKRVDVHRDILHGANIELSLKDDDDINYYYLTPKKPGEKSKPKSKTPKGKKQDEHIVAIIDARTPIYDESGNQALTLTERWSISRKYDAARNNLKKNKTRE